MGVVYETVDIFPFTASPGVLRRSEELLLGPPVPNFLNLGENFAPLESVHFPPEYEPVEFAPPTGVFEGHYLRLEWQIMNFRQPFYHRNADVDELSFQIMVNVLL